MNADLLPFVVELLDGESPAARARELVAGAKIIDPTARRQIAAGGIIREVWLKITPTLNADINKALKCRVGRE